MSAFLEGVAVGRKLVQRQEPGSSTKAWKLAGELASYCEQSATALVWKRIKYMYRAYPDSMDDALRIVGLATNAYIHSESEPRHRFVLSMIFMSRYIKDEKVDPQEILFFAICAGDLVLADTAIRAGADLSMDLLGDDVSMLVLACKLGNPKTIRWILDCNPKIRMTKKLRQTLDWMINGNENADEAKAVKAAFEAQQITKSIKKPRMKGKAVAIRA